MSGSPQDRALAYPPVEVALLDWWRGHYAHVFVALHPFHAVALDRRGELDLDAMKAARPVRWAEVRAMLGEPPPMAFALALWTLVLDARRDDADAGITRRIDRALARHGLMAPWEGTLSPLLERPVGEAFARAGAAEVTAWDEERATPTPLAPADLAAPAAIARKMRAYGPFALHAAGMLVTSGAEDLCSFIAMTDATRAAVRPEDAFEGFYARPDTWCDWINPPGFFDRVPPGRDG